MRFLFVFSAWCCAALAAAQVLVVRDAVDLHPVEGRGDPHRQRQ
jgi:hypothetical protein